MSRCQANSHICIEVTGGVDSLKAYLRHQKDGLYMLVLLASPRWSWCPGEYLLVSYRIWNHMEPANIHQDTSTIWEKLIKPIYMYRAHLFDEVSTPWRWNLDILRLLWYPDLKRNLLHQIWTHPFDILHSSVQTMEKNDQEPYSQRIRKTCMYSTVNNVP